MKRYSIIIPTLNEAESIYDFLMSLQGLREHCEIIVVDAESTDRTKPICLPLVNLFINAAKGRAIQMNAGARKASTNIFIFLHADTYLPDQSLQAIRQGIDSGAQWGRFDIQLIGQHKMLKIIGLMMNWRSHLTKVATGDQTLFMTRKAFLQVAGFPEISLMEDIEMSKRLNQLTPPYVIKNKVKSSARRWELFGVWKMIGLMWSLRLRYYLGGSPKYLSELYRLGIFWKG